MTLTEITAAFRVAQARGGFATSLGTAELRELGAGFLARVVFTARGTSAVFANELKRVIDLLAAGSLGEGQARSAIAVVLDVLGYDSERGGFPGEEVEPALSETLRDLRSFRRMDLIVRTQRDLMAGAGLKMRGTEPARLTEFPAWELVRVLDVTAPRNWDGSAPTKRDPQPRWIIAGGTLTDDGRMVALKGDPIWGELGSAGNFSDALSVDHPPFAFHSGMGWREVAAEDVAALGITGPDGETPEEYLGSRPITLTGPQDLPAPRISLRGVDPEIIDRFKTTTMAETGGKPYVFNYSDVLAKELAAADEAYGEGGAR